MDEHRPGTGRPCPLPSRDDAGTVFSQTVNGRSGAIRARGVLTRGTADQLGGAVAALRSCGHQRVLLDLTGLRSADDLGLRRLLALREAVEAEGGRLTVLPAIDEPGRRDRRSA